MAILSSHFFVPASVTMRRRAPPSAPGNALLPDGKRLKVSMSVAERCHTPLRRVFALLRQLLALWELHFLANNCWARAALSAQDLVHIFTVRLKDMIAESPQPTEHTLEVGDCPRRLEFADVEGLLKARRSRKQRA